jgi:polysaccharide biosynthesis transport protein
MNRMLLDADSRRAPNENFGTVESAISQDVRERWILQYLRIANRRKWLILAIAAGFVALGLVATLLATPLYTATSTLEIQREDYNIVQVDGVEPEGNSVDLEFYQTQYGLLRSDSLALRVAREMRLYDNAEFFEMFGVNEYDDMFRDGRPLPSAVSGREERLRTASNILLDNIDVTPQRLSRLVDVGFTSPSPGFSAAVVNAWTEQFIGSTLERRFEATSYARKFLEERLEQLRGRLEDSERQLVAYASQQGIVSVPGSQSSSEQGLATVERPLVADDLTALNHQLALATADRMQAQSRLGRGDVTAVDALQNPAIAALREQRARLAAEYANMQVKFEPDYPPARSLAAQIKDLDQSIASEEARVRTSLRDTYRASVSRESTLQNRVDELKGALLDLRRRSIQYNIFQRDVDTNRQLYDGLLQRYKEIGVAGGVGANNISVVDPAEVPRSPSSPNLILNLLLSIAIGLAAGAALALALEQIDEGISNPDVVKEKLGVPLLGTVPNIPIDDVMEELKDPKSVMVEAYLSIQAKLALSTDHGIPQTLSVTSTRPAEGKTTTAFSVARSLGRTGKRVLLIDADMRSPSIHSLVGVKNERGLSNFLSGDDDLQDLIHTIPDEPISFMTAGPIPPNAAELLTGPRFRTLLGELRKRFDHVVVDSPPVMGLADAPLLASAVDGSIFVVQAHGTKAGMVRLALDRLRNARTTIVGAVLTKFDPGRSGYGYGYGYAYEYSYGDKGKASA